MAFSLQAIKRKRVFEARTLLGILDCRGGGGEGGGRGERRDGSAVKADSPSTNVARVRLPDSESYVG